VKPDCLVFGFPRCGSTSLWWYFYNHPGVHETDKEIGYWSRQASDKRTLDDYLRNFQSDKFTIDVSPYTAMKHRSGVIEQILELNPDIKLICMLRDPIDRMWSEYHKDRENFLRAVVKMTPEQYKKHNFLAVVPSREFIVDRDFVPLELIIATGAMPPQLARSLYGRHLKKWVELAGDRILYVRLEDLRTKPGPELERICKFLGLKCYSKKLPKLMSFAHLRNQRLYDKEAPTYLEEQPWKEHALRYIGGAENLPRPTNEIRNILMKEIFDNQLTQLKELTGVQYA